MPAFDFNEVERLRRELQSMLPEGLTATFSQPYHYNRGISLAVFYEDGLLGEYWFGWMGRTEHNPGRLGPHLTDRAIQGIADIFYGWTAPSKIK